MPDTKFTVGGVSIMVPPMVFICLEEAWPWIRKLGDSTNNVEATRAGIGIFCAATLLLPEPQIDHDVARRLRHDEYSEFSASVMALMKASGLEMKQAGEAEAATGSMATGPASSPNSPATA